MSMDLQEKIEILQQIGNCVSENGAAENEENVLQNFLPLRDYNKLLKTEYFLLQVGVEQERQNCFEYSLPAMA